MQLVQNETLNGALVVLDGKYFVNCKYTDCNVVFCGGDFAWVNTQFIRCRVSFDGPAARTFNLCKHFGMLKDSLEPSAEPPTSSTVH
jgi:hypothetical protein